MRRRVFVTNIPMHAYVDGWVEVADDTTPEDLNEAIGTALSERGFTPSDHEPSVGELDHATIKGGWEFTTPLEAR